MKFKILPGSELFDKMKALEKQINDADNLAKDACKKLGGKQLATSGRYLGGGIEAIQFEETPDANLWSKVNKYHSLYRPKVRNKEAWAIIQQLPILQSSDLNSILNFNDQTVSYGDSLIFCSRPGVFFGEKYFLVNISDGCKYTPVEGMVEILDSEYQQLNKK